MNKLINTIGIIVLLGILLKLSYVFVYLFSDLDNGSFVAKATGVTFAFASIWFVIKVKSLGLKLTVILLDVCTIIYYYLHTRWEIPVEYAAIIVAAYSGLIVFYVGRIINDQSVTDTTTDHSRDELNRLRTDNERNLLEKKSPKTTKDQQENNKNKKTSTKGMLNFLDN